MPKEDKFDVAVIGAGPAGMMAAGIAAESGARVILIEKNKKPGRKLLLTGNGRCNITNAEFNLRELVGHYKGGEFLFHAFSVFGPKETIKFFEKLGIKTKIEASKRVFPLNSDARDVLDALEEYLIANKVKVIFDADVKDFVSTGKKINKIILQDREIIAKKYILATGGKSYAITGSNGFGFELAKKIGHTIVEPMPALSPVLIKEEWVKNLKGISLSDVELNIFLNNKKQFQEAGEILFTHFGISGPAALNISGRLGKIIKTEEVKIYIDLFPLLNYEELSKGLDDILKKHLNKTAKNILSFFVPEKFAEILLDIMKIDKNKIANNMSKIERGVIVKTLKNIEITPEGILSFDLAVVTSGGISLNEIDHKTMKSKIIDNLFFAGEVIDIDGKSGGFNLQLCWSTGHLAGENIN